MFILHHYPGSPFSEKLRLMLGHKGMAWASVHMPVVMPKPLLTALTGGYRRAPVAQLGADVYCDSALIARLLDRLQPAPAIHLPQAMAPVLAQWADSTLFWTVAPALFQPPFVADLIGPDPAVAKAFAADRAPFAGHLKRPSGAQAAFTLRQYLAWLDACLAAAPPGGYFFGPQPGLADFCIAHNLWFIRRSAAASAAYLGACPRLNAWLDAILAIGHGRPQAMKPEQALELAAAATGHAPCAVQPGHGFVAGEAVSVAAVDYGLEPSSGELVGLDADEVVIRRHDAHAGTVYVHFPRIGFHIQRGTAAPNAPTAPSGAAAHTQGQ